MWIIYNYPVSLTHKLSGGRRNEPGGFPVFFDPLVGPVVKASASRAEDPGFDSRLRRDFSGSSHTNDFNIGIAVDTLPGVWRSRVSAGTGRTGVSEVKV